MTARSTSASRASCCCQCGLAPVVTVAAGTTWGHTTPCYASHHMMLVLLYGLAHNTYPTLKPRQFFTLKPRLAEHPDTQTVSFFFLHVSIRNSLCSNKIDLRIRWPKSSDFGPKSDDSTHRIIKSKNGIGLSSKNVTEQSRPGTAAVRGTHKSTNTSSDRCVGLRIQPRCANAVAAPHRSQTTGSCRSTRTQRASFVATYHARVHTEQQLSCWARMLCLKKKHVKRLGTSLRSQTGV